MGHRRMSGSLPALLCLLALAAPRAGAAAAPPARPTPAPATTPPRPAPAKAPPSGPGALAAEVPPFAGATFLLPVQAQVEARWILPPTEKARFDARLAVDPDGVPLLSFDDRLASPLRQYLVSLGKTPEALAFLPGGALLLAVEGALGFPGEPATPKDDKGVPRLAFQPLVALPLRSVAAMAVAGPEVFCAGADRATGRPAVYRLRVVKGAGPQELELAYQPAAPVTALAADAEALYVATGRQVIRVSRREGTAAAYYTHPSATVQELAVTPAGLAVSTGEALLLADARGALEVMRSEGHRLVAQGGALYLLFGRSLGLLALERLETLASMPRSVRPLRPGEGAAALAVGALRFFEAGPPPYAEEPFAERFDRARVRRLVARVDYRATAKGKARHTVTVAWFEPTGGLLQRTAHTVVVGPGSPAGTLHAAIGGEKGGYMPRRPSAGAASHRFGDDALGVRYPGSYRVVVQVDGVTAAEGRFALDGELKPAMAVFYDDVPGMEGLLAGGLDPRTGVGTEFPLLHLAVRYGTARMVDLLLKKGARPNDLDKDARPALALSTPMFSEWRAKAELLVRAGADVDARDGAQRQPLVHSGLYQADYATFLLRSGANQRARSVYGGDSVLLAAVPFSCTEELVSLLLARGARLDEASEQYPRETALGRAIRYGSEPCVALLLDKGAPLQLAQLADGGNGALFVALDHLGSDRTAGRRRIVDLLLARGATLAPRERAMMFVGDNPEVFDEGALGAAVLSDDDLLARASRAASPEVQALALRAQVARVRQRTEAATTEEELQQAHGHCEQARELVEGRAASVELAVVPAVASPGPGARPQLGVVLSRRGRGGAYVVDTSPGSAASGAGLRPGDVILAVDGARVGAPIDVAAAVGAAAPGSAVRLTLLREGPGTPPELPLTCGLLERRLKLVELARMNLGRWLAENPGAEQAAAVRTLLEAR